MAQPKYPPLSVRIQPDMRAALKAEAARRKVTVNALVLRAVLKEIGQWSDEEVASMRAKPRPPLVINKIVPIADVKVSDATMKQLSDAFARPPVPYGSRLKKR